ncbi:uncharacterized protein BDZ99DRAFT_124546 [Mytilinidion resinicola]|uniref:Lytic polysaccharide monooxygenase n=1 Tax=Mytilinidion resinicola TaxID=574789 RepID=A0A6A6Z6I2_9PEZI|nr:uncharacterized protein BDZ99DRAFT_124546 [Mytilinidion resinicola]KAF2815845.1 hypothetical protein BDZ99DRAFT_124546 [Mytilinidion resinicola]
MMFTTSTMAAAALALFGTANAHMIMKSPVPYGNPNSSPLDDSGSDFPCKSVPYDIVKMNTIEVGVPQTLSFTGSAVHGGGSCQVSVTLDQKPDKNSQWKVIHSIIGGCPSNVTGNLPDDPTGDGAAVFQFTMPKGMPNGQYSLAWTWNNKIGNREMYMNCAPITVTGGGDDTSVMEKLPDMFVANIPSETCSIPEGSDFVYPNPGDSVQSVTVGTPAFGSSLIGNCASMTKMGAGAGKLGTVAGGKGNAEPTGAQSSAGVSQPAATSAVATPVASNPGGVFAPGASSAAGVSSAAVPVPTSFATVVAPSSAAAATSVPAAATSVAAAPAASGSGVPCSTNGAIVCIGSTQFGVCNWGFAAPQDLAAGTTCSNGQIGTKKRVVRRRLPVHFRRHGSNLI